MIKNLRGDAHILTIIITFIVMMILSLLITYFASHNRAEQIKDTVGQAVITVGMKNFNNSYQGFREGYSGAWNKSDEGVVKVPLSSGDIWGHLTLSLDLIKEGSNYVKYNGDGSVAYKLSNLRVVTSTGLFRKTSDYFTATVTITVEMPIRYSNTTSTAKTDYTIKVKHTQKF